MNTKIQSASIIYINFNQLPPPYLNELFPNIESAPTFDEKEVDLTIWGEFHDLSHGIDIGILNLLFCLIENHTEQFISHFNIPDDIAQNGSDMIKMYVKNKLKSSDQQLSSVSFNSRIILSFFSQLGARKVIIEHISGGSRLNSYTAYMDYAYCNGSESTIYEKTISALKIINS